ncbi:threonine/serine exporter family protein [Streptococcus devriesei]|uniref:threonine/serine exporter family protein n=1 Tax=Streptococcus devriesei TaxID=231233 RepID=UPI0003F720BA|nr:threonine/serine exporter family protein [Streptococcus devriesei]
MPIKDYKYIAEVAALAGIIMLESNAECYRVENTVSHILETSQLPTAEAFANTTGLFITLDGPELPQPISLVKRIKKRSTHLSRIHAVNQISRDLTASCISIEQAHQRLLGLTVDKTDYSLKWHHYSLLLLVLSFTILLGGNMMEVVLSFVAALLLLLTNYLKDWLKLNDFIFGIVATLIVAAVIPILIHMLGDSDISFDKIIIAVLMPLFPGTAFTNGFRDSFKGDYGAGLAKILEALIIAVSLGVGVALGLFLSKGIIAWV